MTELNRTELSVQRERALLVGVILPGSNADPMDPLGELRNLARTAGAEVIDEMLAKRDKISAALYVGSGKAQEIIARAKAEGAEVIVFDDPLSPSQQRNWEKLAGMPVIDRQEVILDIFGRHARSRVAVLQVALARARYDLPRLKRRWVHFSRQRGMRGGLGGRGEGEQQIEMDYRQVKRRITLLQAQLKETFHTRALQRSLRRRRGAPVAAIVGYTNAGKSCLFNALTDAGVLVQDQLFATLDPTVRRLRLPGRQDLLLTDTVGFIRKLPHQLIEAFKATLEEVAEADFLIEVLDASSPAVEAHHVTTGEVLREIKADLLPTITVFNKSDRIPDPLELHRIRRKHPDAVFVSARTGDGLNRLQERLTAQLAHARRYLELLLPPDRYDLLALLHRSAQVERLEYVESGIEVDASIPLPLCHQFQSHLRPPGNGSIQEQRDNLF